MPKKLENIGEIVASQFTQRTYNSQNTEDTQLTNSSEKEEYTNNTENESTADFTHNSQDNKAKTVISKKKKEDDKAQITTNKNRTETRRFSLIVPENLFLNIKTIASIRQISVNKAIIEAIELFVHERMGIINKYNEYFTDLKRSR